MKRMITLGLIASAFCAQAAFATQCRHQKSVERTANTNPPVAVSQNADAPSKVKTGKK